jgi:hypothetical protein
MYLVEKQKKMYLIKNDRGDVVELLVYHKEKPLYITQVFCHLPLRFL